MFIRDVGKVAAVEPSVVVIGSECLIAAFVSEPVQRIFVVPRFEHHLIVVAEDRKDTAVFAKFNQRLDHAAGIRPAVDVVAQRNDGVFHLRLNLIDQSSQGVGVTVNVTDRDGAARGGRF